MQWQRQGGRLNITQAAVMAGGGHGGCHNNDFVLE